MHRQESENVIVPEARDENSRDQQWRIESGPGKDVRERIEAGYVEIDEQEAWRWKTPFAKNPNVTLRGDYPIIWSSKVGSRRSTLWWTRYTHARTW
jgi:hypothetical protein